MFRELRIKNRELEKVEAIEILKNCDHGILSTIGENAYPYGVPVNYVYMNDSIYFHGATEGHKLDNIIYNDKVSFCVIGQTYIIPNKFTTKYESVILFGKASEVFEDEKNTAFIEFLNKYSPDHLNKGKDIIKNLSAKTKLIKISIEHICGKGRK